MCGSIVAKSPRDFPSFAHFLHAQIIGERLGLPWWLSGKESTCQCRRCGFDQEDPFLKETETHSSTLTWRIPWTEEPGRLQPMGLQRVGQDLMTEQEGTRETKK